MKNSLDKLIGTFSQLRYWKRTFLLVWESARTFTSIWAILLLVQGILPGIVVILTKFVIDGIVAAKDSGGQWDRVSEAVGYLVLMGLVILAGEVLKHCNAWIRTAQAEHVGDRLSDMIHEQSASLDIAFFESPEYYDLLERAKGDSSSKPLALLESLGSVIQNSVSMLAMAGILIAYAWWLPLVLLVGTLPALAVTIYTDRIYHGWWKSNADERRWASYYDAMLTHEDSAKEMRLFDLSVHFRRLFQAIRTRLRTERIRHLRQQSVGKILATLFSLLTAVAAIGWMAWRVLYGFATLGDLGVFYQIFSRGQSLMGALLGSVGQTVNNSLYLESLFTFLDLEPELVSPENPRKRLAKIERGIDIDSVTFHYPNSKVPALKDFSLSIPAGETVALVGVNGSGKTTLIKLLNRFYDPQEGAIRIDGIDLKEFDPSELRRMMSVLFQFPLHYHATAFENIQFGDLDRAKNANDLEEASYNAGSHDFIMRLPDEYNTLLGKWFVKGTELSGGEWQRLSLARAYYRLAPIVILDEPTSFMDSWAEADWFDRFRKMVNDRIGIVITHRFTIAMRADRIHVIDEGRIIESGSHKELLKAEGFYARSWNAQMRIEAELTK